MTDDNVFKQACRYGDAEAEEHGFQAAIEKESIPFDELLHVADQRALRATLLAVGRKLPADGEAVALYGDELRLHDLLMPAYLDALYIGWRARRLHDEAQARARDPR